MTREGSDRVRDLSVLRGAIRSGSGRRACSCLKGSGSFAQPCRSRVRGDMAGKCDHGCSDCTAVRKTPSIRILEGLHRRKPAGRRPVCHRYSRPPQRWIGTFGVFPAKSGRSGIRRDRPSLRPDDQPWPRPMDTAWRWQQEPALSLRTRNSSSFIQPRFGCRQGPRTAGNRSIAR